MPELQWKPSTTDDKAQFAHVFESNVSFRVCLDSDGTYNLTRHDITDMGNYTSQEAAQNAAGSFMKTRAVQDEFTQF